MYKNGKPLLFIYSSQLPDLICFYCFACRYNNYADERTKHFCFLSTVNVFLIQFLIYTRKEHSVRYLFCDVAALSVCSLPTGLLLDIRFFFLF